MNKNQPSQQNSISHHAAPPRIQRWAQGSRVLLVLGTAMFSAATAWSATPLDAKPAPAHAIADMSAQSTARPTEEPGAPSVVNVIPTGPGSVPSAGGGLSNTASGLGVAGESLVDGVNVTTMKVDALLGQTLSLAGAQLEIVPGALDVTQHIRIEALTNSQLAPLNPGMRNLTQGGGVFVFCRMA